MSIIKYAKRSISLPVALDAELADEAEAEGTTVSALLADAAAHALQTRRGLRAVEDWMRETGVTFSADEIAEVDALLDLAGVGDVGELAANAAEQMSNPTTRRK